MTQCRYCSEKLEDGGSRWRMADQHEERISGYQPNPEGRGVHFLCNRCDLSNFTLLKLISKILDSQEK